MKKALGVLRWDEKPLRLFLQRRSHTKLKAGEDGGHLGCLGSLFVLRRDLGAR